MTVVLAYLGGRVLVRRRPSKGLLAGLWEFPNDSGGTLAQALPGARQRGSWRARGTCSRTLSGTCAACARRWMRLPEGMRAVDAEGLRALPFPTALRVYRQIALEELEGR